MIFARLSLRMWLALAFDALVRVPAKRAAESVLRAVFRLAMWI